MPAKQLFDSHAHIDMDAFDSDREEALKRAQQAGVKRILNVVLGPNEPRILAALDLAQQKPWIKLALGIHPHDADCTNASFDWNDFFKHFCHENIVAVGETGLDYYYENSLRSRQQEAFAILLNFAKERNLPVCVHTRDAFTDTLSLLKASGTLARAGGVIHCFTGNKEEAKSYLDLGAHISFSGITTFKKADAIVEAARYVPLDRLLVETDCPFLAPDPHRGKRNEPAFVSYVAQFIADLRGIPVDELCAATYGNTMQLFRITEDEPLQKHD